MIVIYVNNENQNVFQVNIIPGKLFYDIFTASLNLPSHK